MAKHTPGPYRKGQFNGQWGTAIYAVDANGDDEWHLADVKTAMSSDEREATADLFVAAPDMLAALKEGLWALDNMAAMLNHKGIESTLTDPRPGMRAVIAKAEGHQHD